MFNRYQVKRPRVHRTHPMFKNAEGRLQLTAASTRYLASVNLGILLLTSDPQRSASMQARAQSYVEQVERDRAAILPVTELPTWRPHLD